MRGTHQFHENWATTKFYDSTVHLGIDGDFYKKKKKKKMKERTEKEMIKFYINMEKQIYWFIRTI